jgi:G3E family GTPase
MTDARSLNPTLRVHHTTQSQIALSELFDIRAFSASKSATEALNDVHSHATSESHGHHSSLTTTVIPLPTLSTEQHSQFETFLQSLLWDGTVEGEKAPEILRCKGAIGLEDGRAFVLQGVRDLYELKELPGQTVDEGKVVFIGRITDGEALASSLRRHLGL